MVKHIVLYTLKDGVEKKDYKQIGKNGDVLEAPDSPTKDGHKFLGWSKDNGATYQEFGVQSIAENAEIELPCLNVAHICCRYGP